MAETQDTNPLWSPDGKRTAASRGVWGHSGHLPVRCAASPRPCGCGEPRISLVRAQAEPTGATSGPTAGAEAASPVAPSPRPAQGLEDVCLPAGPSLLPDDWATALGGCSGKETRVTPTQMLSPEQCRQVALAHCPAALCSHLRCPDHPPLDKPQIRLPWGTASFTMAGPGSPHPSPHAFPLGLSQCFPLGILPIPFPSPLD